MTIHSHETKAKHISLYENDDKECLHISMDNGDDFFIYIDSTELERALETYKKMDDWLDDYAKVVEARVKEAV